MNSFSPIDASIGTVVRRIGGEPEDLAEAEFPRCQSCRESMTFYGQLDSIGDDFALADAGVVEVFVCFDCFEAAARISSS